MVEALADYYLRTVRGTVPKYRVRTVLSRAVPAVRSLGAIAYFILVGAYLVARRRAMVKSCEFKAIHSS